MTATRDGRTIGYAMVAPEDGDDDTFAVTGGVAEVVTLVVTGSERGSGAGAALLVAAEEIARDRGFDTLKIAVMSGNDRAERFYVSHGYAVAERVLYRACRADRRRSGARCDGGYGRKRR